MSISPRATIGIPLSPDELGRAIPAVRAALAILDWLYDGDHHQKLPWLAAFSRGLEAGLSMDMVEIETRLKRLLEALTAAHGEL